MSNGPNGTSKWIAIIISITLAAGGILYGAIQSNAKSQVEACEIRLDKAEETIMQLQINNAQYTTDQAYVKEQIREMREDIKDIKKILSEE